MLLNHINIHAYNENMRFTVYTPWSFSWEIPLPLRPACLAPNVGNATGACQVFVSDLLDAGYKPGPSCFLTLTLSYTPSPCHVTKLWPFLRHVGSTKKLQRNFHSSRQRGQLLYRKVFRHVGNADCHFNSVPRFLWQCDLISYPVIIYYTLFRDKSHPSIFICRLSDSFAAWQEVFKPSKVRH